MNGVLSIVDHAIEFDFGARRHRHDLQSANASSTTGDGYYEIALDLAGDGTFSTDLYFYRLLGDVNGDGTVSDADITLITNALGSTGTGLNADVNGDTVVNATDRTLALRSKGRSIKSSLHLDG